MCVSSARAYITNVCSVMRTKRPLTCARRRGHSAPNADGPERSAEAIQRTNSAVTTSGS